MRKFTDRAADRLGREPQLFYAEFSKLVVGSIEAALTEADKPFGLVEQKLRRNNLTLAFRAYSREEQTAIEGAIESVIGEHPTSARRASSKDGSYEAPYTINLDSKTLQERMKEAVEKLPEGHSKEILQQRIGKPLAVGAARG